MSKYQIVLLLFCALVSLNINKDDEHFRISRTVASSSLKGTDCLALLTEFYPSQTFAQIRSRVENTENDLHMFFRSFPPLFYKVIENNNINNYFPNLMNYKTFIAGDAHIENFGLKFFNGKLRLSVNDYDDSTLAPAIVDIVRLLTSAKIANVNLDEKLVMDLIESYLKGLKGEEVKYSKSISNLIKDSMKKAVIDKETISTKKFIFLKKRAGFRELQSTELLSWKKKLAADGEIKDSYSYVKDYGGSAGLVRYEFLIDNGKTLNWFEAKEWSIPSYNVANKVLSLTELERMDMIIKYDQPEITSRLMQFDKKYFFVRNIDNRQLGILIQNFNDSDLEDVLLDEFYALGDFHRTFMPVNKEYQKEISKIRIDDLIHFVGIVIDDLKFSLKNASKKVSNLEN